jgi:hypothetical protein
MHYQPKNSFPYELLSDPLVLSLGSSEIDRGLIQSSHDHGDL